MAKVVTGPDGVSINAIYLCFALLQHAASSAERWFAPALRGDLTGLRLLQHVSSLSS